MLSIRHHKKFLVRFSREMIFSNSFLNRSEIPPDRRQLEFDLGVAVSEDIALKPGMHCRKNGPLTV